ncbi:ribonuclease HII [Candidatus Woesearchaeota archaeon]|nr:ribonuclease HII [Candidatus Woesearchaeota archaeon]
MIVAGVEEAGRGPVIGPLVMAVCTIEDSREGELARIGVKDSKLLTPKQREHLFEKIKKIVKEFDILIVSAAQVDKALDDETLNLNWLEAITSAKLINNVTCDMAILDCPSNNLKDYEKYVARLLDAPIKLVVEHRADVNYLIVAAASILAKVTRDREIEKLKKKVRHNFGSGYPSDPTTKKFLEDYYDKYPELFRKTWASYKNVVKRKDQTKLDGF